jgi:hypothetical protein
MVNNKGKEAPSWFRKRGYPHFDHKVTSEIAIKYVTNSQKVAHHSFYPFLSYTMSTPRYKKEINKVKDKERPIKYASHLDSHIFAYYSHLISGCYEQYIAGTPLYESVIAYRKLRKSNISFAKEAFGEVGKIGESVALCFDISGFFDNLSHSIIKRQWCKILNCKTLPDDHFAVFKAITKHSSVERNSVYNKLNIGKKSAHRIMGSLCTPVVFRNDIRKSGLISTNHDLKGIPQGSPISAVISNVFMMDFDESITALAIEMKGVYRRYCDDILFVCHKDDEHEALSRIHLEIGKLGLEINNDKTEKTTFNRNAEGQLITDNPMQYLGFMFDGQRTYLRSTTLSRYWRRVKAGVRSASKAAKSAGGIAGGDCKIKRQELYEKFTHLGKNNFIQYALRASRDMNQGTIRNQIKKHWQKLQDEISIAETTN